MDKVRVVRRNAFSFRLYKPYKVSIFWSAYLPIAVFV